MAVSWRSITTAEPTAERLYSSGPIDVDLGQADAGQGAALESDQCGSSASTL